MGMPSTPYRAERPSAADTLSERAAALIERDILAGAWEPGAKLAIHALAVHYGIGATPLREGLSRLVSRGLIVAVGQRGFRVSSVSRADLADITSVRALVEAEALRRSISKGGDEWEAGIVSSLHRLRRLVEREPDAIREGAAEFDRLHKGFHRSLLSACGSERLLALHDDLYFQAYRYRRLMMRTFDDPSWFVQEHQDLADIVLARRSGEAVRALTAHLHSTLSVVYEYGETETGR
jgi:GntR family transcriptional regulator, carbon starvation induced regulator